MVELFNTYEEMFEMAKATKKESGQPFDIWVYSVGPSRDPRHNGLRFKASNNGVTVVAGFLHDEYTIYNTTETDLKKFGRSKELKEYATKIKPVLKLDWRGKITDGEFIMIVHFISKGYDVLDAVDKAITFYWEIEEI